MTEITVEQCGGKADGRYDNSTAIKSACERARSCGGAIIRLGAGTWLTGPIELFSNTTLWLDKDAHLVFIPEFDRYTPVWTRWEGVECYGMHPCVFAASAQNVGISGYGTIDGSGQVWWKEREHKRAQRCPESAIEKKLAFLNPGYASQPGGGGGRNIQFLRPPLIQFFNCCNVKIEGVTVQNSPFWTIHPIFCEQVYISGVTVQNPHDSCNTDGIDIDSCCDVFISGCRVSVGDDGIALKSGSGTDGIRAQRPTCRVHIRDCTVGDGHGGVVIGSETAAGIHSVTVENCEFNGTDRGIRIKTRRGRGGAMTSLTFKNLRMKNNLCPVAINMFYSCGVRDGESAELLFSLEPCPVTAETPSVSSVLIENVQSEKSRSCAGFIVGLPESPVHNLQIINCFFETDEACSASPSEAEMCAGILPVAEKAFRVLNAPGVDFTGTVVSGPPEPFLFC